MKDQGQVNGWKDQLRAMVANYRTKQRRHPL